MPRLLARTPPFSSIDRAALTGALAVSIAAPGYVLVFGYGTNGLIPPGSIALGVLFAWTYWSAWESLAIHRETGGAAASISPEIDVFYTMLWMVPLAVVCAVALVEYGDRSVFSDVVEESIQ